MQTSLYATLISLASERMRFSALASLLLAIFYIKVTGDAALVFLEKECTDHGPIWRLVFAVRDVLWGPEPPSWWEVTCQLNSRHNLQGYLDSLVLFSILWAVISTRKYGQRKQVRAMLGMTRVRRRQAYVRKKSSQKIIPAKSAGHPFASTFCCIITAAYPKQTLTILPPPEKRPLSNNNRQRMTVTRYRPRVDDRLHIEHRDSPAMATYHALLLGPMAKLFEAIRIVLVGTFQAMQIPESALKWSAQTDPGGTPVFLGVRSQDTRVDVVLVPGQGINIEVQRLGPARGRLKEVAFWSYEVTYRGVRCADKGTNILYGTSWD